MGETRMSNNRPKAPIEIELAPRYSIEKYVALKRRREREKIAHLILSRFDHRFFRPLGFSLADGQWLTLWGSGTQTARPSGWLIVSIACLAIESLMNFVKGTVRVESAGREFNSFFKSNAEFADLFAAFPAFERKKNGATTIDNKFYCDIRCGVLHQGETHGQWRLLLGKVDGPMVDISPGMRCIFARPILAGVGISVRRYCETLAADEDFTTAAGSQWKKALRKLDVISEMCGVPANALGNPIKRRKAPNRNGLKQEAKGRRQSPIAVE